MINRIHQAIYRPESGWDPIPASHAAEYSEYAWGNLLDESVIDWIEATMGSVAGKTVLDLGAGPGQYSVALAKRGAQVTWHDVSRRYESLAGQRAADAGVAVSFSLGYLESAKRFGEGTFDLVFCRSCWLYSVADKPFARLIYRLVKPGGCVFINTSLSAGTPSSAAGRLKRFLYETLGYKIGHPFPPAGRVEHSFRQFQTSDFQTRRLGNGDEEILFRKPV